MKDLYEILGIEPLATAEEIKEAYRALAKKHHPDKGGDEALFQEIQQAYAILGDAELRADYDATGCFEGAKASPYPSAVEKVASMASAWLDMAVEHGDFLGFVKGITEEACGAAIDGIETATGKLAFAQRFEAQLRWIGEDDIPSPAHEQIKKEITSFHESIKIFKFEIEVADCVHEIMKNYLITIPDALSNIAIGE